MIEPAIHPDVHARTRRSHSSGGFTLIELVVIIVIVAILAGVAVPAMSNITNARTAMAGRQITRDLTYARQRALSTALNTWVVFDVDAGSWSILSENRATPGRDSAVVIQDDATGAAFTRSLATDFPGVIFASCQFEDASEVGFDWRGAPLNSKATPLAGNGSLTFSGGGSIVVEVGTGHTRYLP